MTRPFVSIITINYNNAEGLKQTVRSVIDQQFTDYEFILIDGDSTDGSVEYINQNQDHFSYTLSEPDTGIYNAMNKGVKASSGAYLLFLNSGDFLTSPTALSDFTGHSDFKGDIIYGDYQFKNGHKVYPDTLSPIYFVRTSLAHQSTFFKREVFDSLGLYDESYAMGGDREYFIKAYLDGRFKFQHIQYFLTHFDMEGISNSQDYRKKKLAEDERMFRAHFGDQYEDFKQELALEQKRKEAQRRTPAGIAKRIRQKIKKLWTEGRW